MNTIYTKALFEQFKQTRGLHSDATLKRYRAEFKRWLLEQQEYMKQYIDLLIEMGLSEDTIVELGKGGSNSLIPTLTHYGYDAISITPFDDTFSKKQAVRAYNGQLVDGDYGLELQYHIPMIPSDMLIPPHLSEVGTLITQVPQLHINQLAEMIQAYLQEHKTLIIGSYGNIHDVNIQKNLTTGTIIKDYLEHIGFVEDEFTTCGDTYLHVIKSKFKTKKLNKTIR